MNIKLISFKALALSSFLITFTPNVLANDIQNGKKLHNEKCYQCHAEKSGLGNGDVIYTRSDRKVHNLNKLKGMVNTCNTQLRLDLFPEDEADIISHLNYEFYKFK
jgi:hypothetical protein